jgi:MFS family permease
MKDHRAIKIGALHASYGLGAFLSPFAATYFSGTRHWNYLYIISIGLALINTLILGLVFRGRQQEGGKFTSLGHSLSPDNYHSSSGRLQSVSASAKLSSWKQ